MVYKIVWRRGGETAERYSNKSLAKKVLKGSRLTGSIVKIKLGNAGRTMPFTAWKYGDSTSTHYPKGKKLKWFKTPSGVYRTHIA